MAKSAPGKARSADKNSRAPGRKIPVEDKKKTEKGNDMPRNVHLGSIKKRNRNATENPGAKNVGPQIKTETVYRRSSLLKVIKKASAKMKDTPFSRFGDFIKRKFREFVDFSVEDRDLTFKDVKVRHVKPSYYIRNVFVYYLKLIWVFARGVVRKLLPIVTPLCGIAIIILSAWALSTHSLALKVSVNGETLGYVESESRFNDINSRVSGEVLEKTGENYVMEELPTMELSVVKNDDLTDENDIYTALSSMADDYMGKTYGLFIDGTLVSTSRDEGDFERLKEKLVEYYLTGADGETWEILNDFEVVRDSYDKKYLCDYTDLWNKFTRPVESVKHTVVLEDEWETLAAKYGVSVTVLKMMNPGIQRLTVGDVVEVGQPAYQISVKTTRRITYNEKIPYETKYIDNPSIYKGNTSIKTYGSAGNYSITAELTVIDGEETGRTIVSKVQTSAPVTREVYIGTKTISPSGKFIWPLGRGYQFKTSGFGWRTLRGRSNFHRGVDLAAAYGTPIYAADAGTVVAYGWDSYGLGYCVKINHGNGIISVYGHCSRLSSNVYLGKKVYQGELIAYVGSTGNSTGNHLHFGLCYSASGTFFDPWPYIS